MDTIPGYQTHRVIYSSANSLVYRAIRDSDGQPVIIKALREEYPLAEELARCQQEYSMTSTLEIEGVIRSYSLEQIHHALAIVFEDFGADSLTILQDSGRLSLHTERLESFLEIAIQITSILGEIHDANVIHKDINPSNIVLNPATGQLKIIDFGIATVLPRENPVLKNPGVLEGTLAYISPEQTGRMNRQLDYRTDFYSLGITFYELITGSVPFEVDDPLELVHCHMAKQPVTPCQRNQSIPKPVSDIVMKLMAKDARDRYQSAYGLRADLEYCLTNLPSLQAEDFVPGQRDFSARLHVPQKLYGRDNEIDTLLRAFERVCSGVVELVLVTGYSGIGKTALVRQVHVPMTEQRGYFCSGKFDQLQRNNPYSALIQACRALMRHLLTEDEAEIAAWREKLSAALRPHAQIIIDLVSELELIVGPQPSPPELGPTQTQNRFHLAFQSFVKALAQPEHPLIILIDDLQWADVNSLGLLQTLLTDPGIGNLCVIGAYRDNEVDEAHPLHLTIESVREAKVRVSQIALGPLSRQDVDQLLADTLYQPIERVAPLAQLVFDKTGGNPFFTLEFVKALYADGLLDFDHTHGQWHWNLKQIEVRAVTDNVVELMARQVQRLPMGTRTALQMAACIGNQFTLQTLSIVCEKTPQATAADLDSALREGLVYPVGETYKYVDVVDCPEEIDAEYRFVHDRVQQASYSLIPAAERQAVHWRIGWRLLDHTPTDRQEERLFDIVNHLDQGLSLLDSLPDRDEVSWQLAKLNLEAGQRAIATNAYGLAMSYLDTGLDCLPREAWQEHYELALQLHTQAAQAAYLCGDIERMEQFVQVVLQQATTLLDKASVYEIMINSYTSQNKSREAVQVALQALALFGVSIPARADQMDVDLAARQVQDALGGLGSSLESRLDCLRDLPRMTDPNILAVLRLLSKARNAAFLSAPDLMTVMALTEISLAIQYGCGPTTPLSFGYYATELCGRFRDIETGYRFGQLALELLERHGTADLRPRTYMIVRCVVGPWKEHVRNTLPAWLQVYQMALEAGELTLAAGAVQMYCNRSLEVGKNLADLDRDMAVYAPIIRQLKDVYFLRVHQLYWQYVLNLRGQSPIPWQLTGEQFDEDEVRLHLLETSNAAELTDLHLSKLVLCYLFWQLPLAVEQAELAGKHLDFGRTTLDPPRFCLYDSLVHLAIYSDVSRAEQQAILERVAGHQERLEFWADHAPMNFAHRFYLVEAERARVLGNDGQAREYYDRAIALAGENRYINEEAMANEVTARFYLSRGRQRIARLYLDDARYAYQRWGALAKVEDLEQRYPEVLKSTVQRQTERTEFSTSSTATRVLDVDTILKASRILSGEIVLHRLLGKMMQIVIENAGAEKGFLLLPKRGSWCIEAEGYVNETEVRVLQSIPIETVSGQSKSPMLSNAIVNYVIRTHESLVLSDAVHEGEFTRDPYVVRQQPKSVLCMPLLNQGRLTGLLYLENNLAIGAFTADRLEVLKLLSSQIVVSIENALLYSTLAACRRGRTSPQTSLMVN